MKLTFEQTTQILLDHGFKTMESEKDDSVVIIGKFGLNYCSCCHRQDGTITIFHQKDDNKLHLYGSDNGSTWVDPLNKTDLKRSLSWLSVKMKK